MAYHSVSGREYCEGERVAWINNRGMCQLCTHCSKGSAGDFRLCTFNNSTKIGCGANRKGRGSVLKRRRGETYPRRSKQLPWLSIGNFNDTFYTKLRNIH